MALGDGSDLRESRVFEEQSDGCVIGHESDGPLIQSHHEHFLVESSAA